MSLEKIEKIRSHEKFVEGEIDAIFITKPENVIYILGFKVESDVFIIIPKEDHKAFNGKILVFLNALEYDQANKEINKDKSLANLVELLQIPSGNPHYVYDILNNYNLKCAGFEDNYISVKRYKDWNEKFLISKFIGISEVISDVRIKKTRNEIERMKKAAEFGDIGFEAIYNSIREGSTEKELAAEAEYAMRKAGSDGTSFDTIVASGERSAYPHALTSDKKIQDGDIIIVDIGAMYKGYCSDMTRTFIFGEVEPEKARLINLVNDGQKFALENIKAKIKCMDIDKLIRDYFEDRDKNWSSRFIHSLGHGVGIDIHEDPFLSPISQMILEENMVVTVEPGIYIPGLGGARTEDQIVIKNDGYEALTQLKKFYY